MSELPLLVKLDEHTHLVKTCVENLNTRRFSTEKAQALDAIRRTKRLLNEMERQVKLLEVVEE